MWCFHDRLREFTFKSGAVIKMCPDCTMFDNKRREVLKTGHVEMVKSKQEIHWGVLLDKSGLSMSCGDEVWLGYGADVLSEKMVWKLKSIDPDLNVSNVEEVLHAIQGMKYKRATPTDLDDYEHVQRFGRFEHSQAMPRRFNSYCTSCTDVVVDKSRNKVRVTKGVYLPIEHECAAVRVYNLSGELLEVKAI